MSTPRKPLSDRIKRAAWRPIPPDARSEHLSAVESAIEAGASPGGQVVRARRRWSAILVTAALIVLPTGIALAAESSVPGDVLYPVKQVTESIRSLVDDEVIAEHRIEELEKLVAADAPAEVIADQVDRATEQVDRLERDHQLGSRLDQATAGVASDRPTDGEPPVRDEAVDKPSLTTSTTQAFTTDTTPAITTATTAPLPGNGTTTTVPRERTTTTTTTTKADSTTTTIGEVETHLVSGYVHAGPTCPVVRFPPDPACEDLPVPGAVLVVEGAAEVKQLEANDEGRFEVGLPNGSYLLVPRPHDGLLGTAPPQEFVVEGEPVELDVAYDTGIR